MDPMTRGGMTSKYRDLVCQEVTCVHWKGEGKRIGFCDARLLCVLGFEKSPMLALDTSVSDVFFEGGGMHPVKPHVSFKWSSFLKPCIAMILFLFSFVVHYVVRVVFEDVSR